MLVILWDVLSLMITFGSVHTHSRPYFALFHPFPHFLVPCLWNLWYTCIFMHIIRLRWVCVIDCSPLGVINIISSRLGGQLGISQQVHVLCLWNVWCNCTYMCIIRLRWVLVINCCLLFSTSTSIVLLHQYTSTSCQDVLHNANMLCKRPAAVNDMWLLNSEPLCSLSHALPIV